MCVYRLYILENSVHKGVPVTVYCTIWCQYFVNKIEITGTLMDVHGEEHLILPKRTVEDVKIDYWPYQVSPFVLSQKIGVSRIAC